MNKLAKSLGYQLQKQFLFMLKSIPDNSTKYLEYRLDNDSQLDFLYCIDNKIKQNKYPLSNDCYEIFENILNYYPQIPYFWVEHDNINENVDFSTSCIHVCLIDYFQDELEIQNNLSTEQVLSILDLLACKALSHDKNLVSLIEQLNLYGQIIHISVMRSRSPSSIKFYVKVHRSKLFALLDQIQWKGCVGSLTELLNLPWLQADQDGFINVDLKFEDKLQPYIALVSSRITLNNNGAKRILSLIEKDVIKTDKQINSVMNWLNSTQTHDIAKWIDVKTIVSSEGIFSTKLYFGMQDTKLALIDKLCS